ncbi:MAG: OmpA family protein [Saprospiraceae bacterium]
MRNFLIVLLSILWLILGWLYCKVYNRCCTDNKEVSVMPISVERSGPILFNWGNATPILGDGWSAMRDSLALLASDTTSLEINGWYCLDAAPDENENTGIARAAEVRKLFADIPDDRMILVSRGVQCDSSFRSSKFESVSFAKRIKTENIKEIDETTMIYFPFNSTRKLNNTEVEKYLDDVAERVKKSNEKVQLIGHTDAIGSEESNIVLGQQRCDIVKQYLIKQGVAESQIIATTKGESNPIAGNDTEADRAKNRRTELQIIK